MKHWKVFLIVLIVGIGAGLYLHGRSFPVYTDVNGPRALVEKLRDAPEASRTERWYEELAKIETPHKRYTDLGVGIISLGAGLGLAVWLTWKYDRCPLARKWGFVVWVWCWLWVIRGPLVLVYFCVRAMRFDYPPWADSIIIPIFSTWITLAVGLIGSLAALAGLLAGYSLPEKIRWRRPQGVWGHGRFVLVALWLILLVGLVGLVVVDGDVGTLIACTGAVPVLLAVLWAVPKAADAAGLPENTEGPKPLATTAGGV